MSDILRPSVVHVMGRLDVGGAERMLLQITRHLAEGGHSRHTVVALSGLRGRLSEEFEAAGVADVPCALRPTATFPVRLWRTFRQLRPDVVVSHVSLASGLVLLVAALAGVRQRVAVMHSDGDGRALSAPRRAYRAVSRRLLGASATKVVGVTTSTLAFSGKRPGPNAFVVPNAVDLQRFTVGDASAARAALGIPDGVTVVLHVGRGAPEKNRQALLPCLRVLNRGSVLIVSGAETIDDLGVLEPGDAARLVNAGVVDDVRPLLAAADVLLLPSVREGLPLVVLEALASGRPVVASDLPGIRAACAHNPDVYLVPVESTPEDFAAAVQRAVAAKRSAGQIRATVEGSSHDLDRVLEEWRALCQPVI